MISYEISGTYGNQQTPCTVFCWEKYNGSTWYCIEGSKNINLAPFSLLNEDGIDVETIQDVDTMTAQEEINSLEELLEEFGR